jgi:hypothetical protein
MATIFADTTFFAPPAARPPSAANAVKAPPAAAASDADAREIAVPGCACGSDEVPLPSAPIP